MSSSMKSSRRESSRHVDLEMGVRGHELRDERDQAQTAEGARRREPHPSPHLRLQLAHLRARLLERLEERLRPLHERQPSGRRPHAARGALE